MKSQRRRKCDLGDCVCKSLLCSMLIVFCCCWRAAGGAVVWALVNLRYSHI